MTDPLPFFPGSALVGRDRELAALREHLAAALAGRGSLVLIGGEAGIGKTALAEVFCAEAAGQGATVLVGRSYDLAETPPYGPWAEALARTPADDDLPFATREEAQAALAGDEWREFAATHPTCRDAAPALQVSQCSYGSAVVLLRGKAGTDRGDGSCWRDHLAHAEPEAPL